MLSTTLFYIFSTIIVLSCLGVVSSKNPVYSVLFLILAFINSAILFLFLNAEFLAMLLIVVYVGAVAVLFLFVVMMLNVKNEEKNIKFQKYTPFTLLIVTVVFVEILYIFVSDDVILKNISLSENLSFKNNTIFLGNILYTDYFLLFQISGIILLVAMIGAIVLTLRSRTGVRKQVINKQISTSKSDVIEIAKVKSGDGA
ncbi:MAG: NADH:ubiquinone oxidoreductase subunit J [SAR116 cluster bacterium]|nr:NADH:ubiquinone oxidoreductase subunit J [SAR116 cluster bacterium]